MLKEYFPIFNWLLNYHKGNLRGDLASGLTVAVMLVPHPNSSAMSKDWYLWRLPCHPHRVFCRNRTTRSLCDAKYHR